MILLLCGCATSLTKKPSASISYKQYSEMNSPSDTKKSTKQISKHKKHTKNRVQKKDKLGEYESNVDTK